MKIPLTEIYSSNKSPKNKFILHSTILHTTGPTEDGVEKVIFPHLYHFQERWESEMSVRFL